ncbi:MAG: hypothetical protein WA461_09930 [Nitrososphaeraceae archaeon]|jgi:hypothetical protein
MSISILKLGTGGIKDAFKWYVKEHASEMAIVGVMVAISATVAILATGDFTEAIGKRGR